MGKITTYIIFLLLISAILFSCKGKTLKTIVKFIEKDAPALYSINHYYNKTKGSSNKEINNNFSDSSKQVEFQTPEYKINTTYNSKNKTAIPKWEINDLKNLNLPPYNSKNNTEIPKWYRNDSKSLNLASSKFQINVEMPNLNRIDLKTQNQLLRKNKKDFSLGKITNEPLEIKDLKNH